MGRPILGPNNRPLIGIDRPLLQPPLVTAQAEFSVTLTDTSGAGSSPFARFGVAFEAGDVPSGSILTADVGGTPIRIATMEENTWSDGSLRKATAVIDATDVGAIGAGASITVDISATSGSQSTSGVDPFTYLNGQDDLVVEVRNHTGSEDQVDVGNLDFSLQAAIANTNRREIQGDTPVCVRAYAWQLVGVDIHLQCRHYVDLWLNSGGTVVGVEWTPVLSQSWHIEDPFGTVRAKQRRDYDATVLDGVTTLESYTGLQHAYHCSWAALRSANDDQHARRIWLNKGSAMPTLNVAYSTASRQKMMRASYVPPLRLDETYSATDTTGGAGTVEDAYIPLGDWPNAPSNNSNAITLNNRTSIASAGGYSARGLIGHFDSASISEQTAQRWREARVGAQTALAINQSHRDHRSDGTDITNKLIPAAFSQLGAQTYTGLAAETNYDRFTGTGIGYDVAAGGSGAFNNADSAHSHSYAYFMAFAEGERYLYDAVLSQAVYFAHFIYGGNNSNPRVLWEKDGRTGLPTTQYGTNYLQFLTERDMGWSLLSLDAAYALCPDDDPHLPLINNYFSAAETWLSDSIDEMGASQLAGGVLYVRSPAESKTFMNHLKIQSFARSRILHEGALTSHDQVLDIAIRQLAGIIRYGPYAGCEDFRYAADEGASGDPEWTTWHDVLAGEIYMGRRCTCSGSVVTNTGYNLGMHVQNDDIVYPYNNAKGTGGSGLSVTDPPPELTIGTAYHVVNASVISTTSASFQLATTQGGTPVTLTDTASSFPLGGDLAVFKDNLVIGDGVTLDRQPNDDGFGSITSAAVEMAWACGSTEIALADVQKWRTFFAPRLSDGYENHGSWNLDGSQIRALT